MPPVFLQQHPPYPASIRALRSLVALATIAYSGLFDLAVAGILARFPDFMLLSPTVDWRLLFSPLTASITIPFPGFGLSVIVTLAIASFFLSPMFGFVCSFLSEKIFIRFLIGLALLGTASFLAVDALLGGPSSPCSLFGGLALAIVVFWTLLHRKGQSTLLLAFPISRGWVVFLSAWAVLYSPVENGEWAHVAAILCMSAASYGWGITRWRLRSNVEALESFEDHLESVHRACSRFVQWYVLRPFRTWFHKS